MLLKSVLRNHLLMVILAFIVGMYACQTPSAPSGQQANADTLSKDSIAQNVKEVVYPLPAPFELTQMLNDIGAAYVGKNLNPVSKVEKYATEKDKAVNLGVYGADLAYATTYNKEEDIKAYLKAVRTLIDALGVNIDYSPLFSDEVKMKANNKDTLVQIITNTFYATYSSLKDKNSPEMAVMMVSGMWVELMFIATHISKDTYNNSQIVDLIAKQKDSYEKLMNLIEKYPDHQALKDLSEKLSILKPVFAKVDQGLTVSDYNILLNTIEKVRKEFVL
ncbi:MAG: hypothetical protein ACP5PZ_07115 [Bacteroidales bacterium]